MKFVAISGGWRKTNAEIEFAVREAVRAIMKNGDGIICGGALGVDYFALDEAMKSDEAAERIKVFLPTSLEKYVTNYRYLVGDGGVDAQQADALIGHLLRLKKINPAALIENPKNEIMNDAAYFDRDAAIVNAADELLAFHVVSEISDGPGTLDAISKARAKGIPITVREFDLTE